LRSAGYEIIDLPAFGPDGGKDFLASINGIRCLVSCKHYILSNNHVGADDEKNITDRMAQFNATIFIGFYSTGITMGLKNRLDGICSNKCYSYVIYGPIQIAYIMQSMDTKILQSFGLYPVSQDEYKPLKCMICEKDILTDENIPNSVVGMARLTDDTYDYAYGCKPCFLRVPLKYTHLELEQALHVSHLLFWEEMIDEWIEEEDLVLCKDFYKNRNKFRNRVLQRQYPQTDGTWYGLSIR
jgi:hypothetical protein